MNQNLFFENFELLADAPNGIHKLREMILQLAVMGKLVPQDPNEEPASALLEEIKTEKKKLFEVSNLKKDENFPPIEKSEIKFEVPQSWEWVRLGEVINYNGAQKVSSENILDDAWLLDLEDIEKNTSKILNYVRFKDKKSKSTKSKFNKGDVLYGKLRPYLNKVVVAEESGYCTTEIVPLNIYTGIDPYYLMYSLRRPDFLEYVNSKTYGTKMPRLGTEDAKKSLFPLPPLTEQKRIVVKVDELMALCDKLEVRRQKKQELQGKLNDATLDKMLSAENQEEFEQHWQHICENFDLLYDNPENVEKLKQAILQLAVQGKIVLQNPEDEPASFLIEKIEMEKRKSVKRGKICQFQSVSQNGIENKKEIPFGWEDLILGDCIELISGQHLGKEEQNNAELGFPYLTGPADFGPLYPTATRWTEKKKALSKKDDILITVKGAGVGKTNILGLDEAAIGRQLMAIRPIYLDYKFVYLLILASYDKFQELSIGLTVPGISREDILNFRFGLPPLAEQKRIVEKVEQLTGLCDELESKLRKEREDSEKLVEAVVKCLLEGADTEKVELDRLIPLPAVVD